MNQKIKFTILAVLAVATNSAMGALFTSSASIAANNTNYEGQDIVVIGCTLTIDGSHTFSDVLVFENGVINHSPATNSLAVGLDLTVSNDVVIEFGSAISADALGYGPGGGPGAGASKSATAPFGLQYVSGGGGAYGGNGGESVGGVTGGLSYGEESNSPNPGSGGGAGFGAGGAGGGVVNLTIGGALVLDGEITANGGDGFGLASGGGSGGGIRISAASAFGEGLISANGGGGEPGEGGGGGGGRVALSFIADDFRGSVSAHGGQGFVGGGAGTIYMPVNAVNNISKTILDNGGIEGAETPIGHFPNGIVIVTNGAIAICSEAEQSVQSLLIASNSFIVCSATYTSFQVVSNVVIDVGGGLIADGAGGTTSGLGTLGATLETNNILSGGGGGNGGNGGSSAFGAGGGNSTAFSPQQEAAGGAGGNRGGAGGGELQIRTRGSLILDGTISANGNPGVADGSGGGAGGGIMLTAAVFTGEGFISANGGSGQLPYGGGGGGGVIAISTTGTNHFTGNITAYAGDGATVGGAGKIVEVPPLGVAQIIIDNGGRAGANTPLVGSFPQSYDLSIMGGAIASVSELLGTIRNVVIGSNSFLMSATIEALNFSFGGNVTIETTGGIVLDGHGNAGGIGQGAGQWLANGPGGGGGGGYGGNGGASGSGARGGAGYGTLQQPESFGSGGGISQFQGPGSAGGGGIQLRVIGTLLLQGKISANGANGVINGAGGGSGGGIWVIAGVFSGTGSITANGGSGQLPEGGGGGGGRIAVVANTNSFTGLITAFGGAGFAPGGAGTIFTAHPNSTQPPQLVIDGGGTRAFTTIPQGLSGGLIVRGGSVAVLSGAKMVSLTSLFVGSNSFIVQSNQTTVTINVSGIVVVQSGGGIVAGGLVFEDSGAGTGGTARLPGEPYFTGGGGGYGGNGGNANSPALGGSAYGSVEQPIDPGSNGGGRGGAGGGALQLHVTGTLDIDGLITANGGDSATQAGGGGSGGAIFLVAASITGAGSISANGGAGDLPNGGGGGGGRISLYYQTNTFSGSITAFGGPGFVTGGAGSIYLNPSLAFSPLPGGFTFPRQVIVDNGGAVGARTPLGQIVLGIPTNEAGEYYDLIVSGGADVFPTTKWYLRTLLVESNGVISQGTNIVNINVLDDAAVQTNAAISANGQGWDGNAGPDPGTTATNDTGSGGGYGGMGGASDGGALGGETNGSAQMPVGWGSGGGVLFGQVPNLSPGGGAIQLSVGGTLTVNGSVSAGGSDAIFPGAGGGAGGSVWLNAGTLAGVGAITANGGIGQGGVGGGGGGGRIALYVATNGYSGATTVAGGIGFAPGKNGSLYISTNAQGLIMPEGKTTMPLLAMQPPSVSVVPLTWIGVAGALYQVQLSTDLITWRPYGGVISGVDGMMSVSVALSGQEQCFFRLVPAN